MARAICREATGERQARRQSPRRERRSQLSESDATLLAWHTLEHPRPLLDRQPDPGPVLGYAFEDAPGLIEAAPREREVDHTLPVFAPLLDLVEVARPRRGRRSRGSRTHSARGRDRRGPRPTGIA
jgi:hypothetical protein